MVLKTKQCDPRACLQCKHCRLAHKNDITLGAKGNKQTLHQGVIHCDNPDIRKYYPVYRYTVWSSFKIGWALDKSPEDAYLLYPNPKLICRAFEYDTENGYGTPESIAEIQKKYDNRPPMNFADKVPICSMIILSIIGYFICNAMGALLGFFLSAFIFCLLGLYCPPFTRWMNKHNK